MSRLLGEFSLASLPVQKVNGGTWNILISIRIQLSLSLYIAKVVAVKKTVVKEAELVSQITIQKKYFRCGGLSVDAHRILFEKKKKFTSWMSSQALGWRESSPEVFNEKKGKER